MNYGSSKQSGERASLIAAKFSLSQQKRLGERPGAFHPAAETEHLETVTYYESKQPGMGTSYLVAFESATERVRPHIVIPSSGAHAFHTPFYSERLVGLFKSWPLHTIDAARSIGWAGFNQAPERDGSLRSTPSSLRR